jgi:hypothetical protein
MVIGLWLEDKKMVTVNAEIFPPAVQTKTRKVFAFGLVKVKLCSGDLQKQQADDLRVLGLVVIEDQCESPDENI